MKEHDTEKISNIPVEPTYNVDKVNEHLEPDYKPHRYFHISLALLSASTDCSTQR